jgi:DNA-directed RNA polymerase specialized sigma subunit
MRFDRESKERTIENFLNKYNTYKIGVINCQKQLDYIMPTLTARYDTDGQRSAFYISNNTEQVALDRITSKKALDLLEEIEQYKHIISSIENALGDLDEKQKNFVKYRYFHGLKMYEIKELMGYSEEKSLYKIRKGILDKFLISLNNLLSLK